MSDPAEVLYEEPAPRSLAALGALAAITWSVLSLLFLLSFDPLFESRVRTARPVALVLVVGFVGGALLGHVLGLLAFFNEKVRSGERRGRRMAAISAIAGIVLLLTCTLLALIGPAAFDAVGELF
jgi:multisubunit Na+/H+ antiporter MnhB subunit